MGYRVFISHGSADRWVAEQIAARLKADCGAATFIDVDHLKSGDDIEQQIFDEMPRCDELVVLLTPWSVDRNWLWVEIGAARALGKRIVAVLYQVSLENVEREKGGATFLRAKNVVEINNIGAYFADVKKRAGGSGGA
ncbi:MAG: toll/interleukin-1 receptor domain-containing protein [Proteobacteria bacterium]|nr:toll/interleukin-1 receptor domain-containing protein [Pseudomonadota bacterium]